tara:strand:+ start:1521 stop:2087 length:567 start_codon:yes stop_codon:yes gene_type:complete
MKQQSYFLIAISTLTLFNCATLTTGQDQVISIDTPNCPAASCKLTNSEGTYYVNRTPGTVTINKSGSNLNVICGMNGSEEAMSTDSNTESMTWGNILVGGIIGYAVDAGTGSAYEYPSLITHPLDCRDEMQTTNQYNRGGAKLKMSSQSSTNSEESLEEKLIKLKKLFDDGLISEELYIKQQALILQD